MKICVDKQFELLTEQQQLQLAEKYLPIMMFDAGGFIIQPEYFFPKEIEMMIDNSSILIILNLFKV